MGQTARLHRPDCDIQKMYPPVTLYPASIRPIKPPRSMKMILVKRSFRGWTKPHIVIYMRRNRSVLYRFSSGTISKIAPQRDLPAFSYVTRLNSLYRIFPVLTTPLLLTYLEKLSITADRIPDDFDLPNGVGQRFFNINVFTRFEDRKSTRLNSSHVAISYAVFCLKKKK